MNPEDVERLLGRVEPVPPSERLERNLLAAAGRALPPARRTREFRRWGVAGVAAACVLLSVVVWRIVFPRPGDPGWTPCRVGVELETHLDASLAEKPPAFPTVGPSLDAYAALFRRADAVKPLPQELGWQRVPWVTDLQEAQRLARNERRPIFAWVSSDDPLGRCCGCAAALRAGPLSRDEVIRRISTEFVPAALDKKTLPEEFLKSIRRQLPQYHGLWIISPDGKVLGGIEKRFSENDVLQTLDAALKLFGPVAPRSVEPIDLLRGRGAGLQRDGGVSLAVVARLMHKGARDGPVAFDALNLSAPEWASFVPPQRAPGTAWAIPDGVARKFCRILSPVSDEEFTPRPEHATQAELRAVIESAADGVAILRLTGRWDTEHPPSENKRVRASASAEGLLVFDLEKNSIRSFLLVATGTYGVVPEVRESGAVVEWTDR